MFKKILIASLLITTCGCFSLLNAQVKEPSPKLPNNLARYENQYPMDLFKNAAVKARLHKLLGKAYGGFMEAIFITEPMERQGDLLIGRGCAKGLCSIYEAMIVIDLSTKTIHCGIVATQLKPKFSKYSEAPGNFPAVIKEWSDSLVN